MENSPELKALIRKSISETSDKNDPLISNGKISIVIVTYNAANTLQKCLDSIFQQTYPDIEVELFHSPSGGVLPRIETEP